LTWQRLHQTWDSPALLGRSMDLLILGHVGTRVLVFPTSRGSYHEWEDRHMPDAVGEQLAAGTMQLFCVASADDASWYNETIPIHERAEWQSRFDAYLRDEVLPRTLSLNPDPFLITTGASFGGYHALNFAMRHPDLVNRTLSMSGLPDIKRLTDGWSDDAVYFQNPADFVRHEHDAGRLAALRRMDIILAVGRDDSLCASNEEFSGSLWSAGIGNSLRVWDGWAHDWPYWQRMLQLYIGGHD
jgi:esterase/lipase superfamily enzyme